MTLPSVWVFHRGALGDSVLLWPLLRARRRGGVEVVFVTDRSKGELAAEETGARAIDAEQERFNQLWRADARPERIEGVGEVIALAGTGEADRVWAGNAEAMFPGSRLPLLAGRPDSPFAHHWTGRGGGAAPRTNPRGPVVLHVGAGSAAKRWPMARWLAAVSELHRVGVVPKVIAGEVEAEKFSPAEREAFSSLGGGFLQELESLASELRSARLVVAADCGPGHLAAQLGVPVLSLFGPTDPRQWAPVGPQARTIAPERPAPMTWLEPASVVRRSLELLKAPSGPIP
jgi:heptosyltransferase III